MDPRIPNWTYTDNTKEKALDFSRASGFARTTPDYLLVEVAGIEPASEKPTI